MTVVPKALSSDSLVKKTMRVRLGSSRDYSVLSVTAPCKRRQCLYASRHHPACVSSESSLRSHNS
jgi:hypothetical protein